METVEVVIKIPKKDFEELQSNYVWWGKYGEYIKNGTVLPKEHGRLIDAKALKDVMYHEAFEVDSDMQRWDSGNWIRYKMFENAIHDAPTIIEADKEEQNDNKM